MRRTVEKTFFALLRFEINGESLCENVKNLITPETLPALFKLAKRHDLAHLIGDALDKNYLLPDGSEAKKRFLQERNMAVYRYEQQRYELEQIASVLEEAEIPFIPLKGSVIKGYYPQPWMRTSCDIDILVELSRLDSAKAVLEVQLGYRTESVESTHDVSLFAPSGVHLELHHALAEGEPIGNVNELLGRAWEYTQEVGSFEKAFTDDMFYFYHVAHMAKHFEIGGCGVRAFLDAYLLKRREEYSTQAVERLLKEGGLFIFAQGVEETADVWFGAGESTALSQEIQDYILYAGMYADTENRAAVQQAKKGGRLKYVFSRIFLPYEQLRLQYPSLEGKKWRTPFYQVGRWFRLLFGKDSKNVARTLKANASVETDKKQRVAKLLKTLDL